MIDAKGGYSKRRDEGNAECVLRSLRPHPPCCTLGRNEKAIERGREMGVRRRGGKVFRINRPPMGWDGCPHIRYMMRSIALVVVAASPGAGATEASGRIFCGAHSSSSSSSSKTTIWGIRSGVKENPPFPPLNFVPPLLALSTQRANFFFRVGCADSALLRRGRAKQDCPPPANVRPILCRPLAAGPDDNKSSNLLNLLPAKVLLHHSRSHFRLALLCP